MIKSVKDMRKYVALFLALMLILSFAVCSNSNSKPAPSESTAADMAASESTAEASEETQLSSEPGKAEEGHTHSYEITIVEATCAKDGYMLHSCSCGDAYQTDIVPSSGPRWGSWKTTKEPSVFSTGESQRTCAVCGETETKVLDRLPPFHS